MGITWDSACGTIEILDRRVAKITSTIDSIIDFDLVLSARRLASFTGQTKHCIMSTFGGLNDLQGQVAFRIYMQLLRVCFLVFFVGYSLDLCLRAYFAPRGRFSF